MGSWAKPDVSLGCYLVGFLSIEPSPVAVAVLLVRYNSHLFGLLIALGMNMLQRAEGDIADNLSPRPFVKLRQVQMAGTKP